MAEGTAPPTEEVVEPSPEETFAAEQKQKADLQNLPEGAVPETRPIASQHPNTHRSQTEQRAAELGVNVAGADDSAMGLEAYEKADSEAQARKAAKQARTPSRFETGQRVKFTDENEINAGRVAVVLRVVGYASPEDALKAQLGNEESRFAKVSEYEVATRDGRNDRIVVSADHIYAIDDNEFNTGRRF